MIQLYGHPFAAFAWKALIAAYARDVAFEFRMVDPDHPDNMARIAELSPTGQFPALVDADAERPPQGGDHEGGREITQSNAVIAYLDRIGDAPPMIPADPDAAIEARMLADVFDDYVSRPQVDVVRNAMRADGDKDPLVEREAAAMLDKSYAWLARRIGEPWALGDRFTIADCAAAPALFYADWVHPIPAGPLQDYRARLLAHSAVARVVDEARPYRALYPLGAPDRD